MLFHCLDVANYQSLNLVLGMLLFKIFQFRLSVLPDLSKLKHNLLKRFPILKVRYFRCKRYLIDIGAVTQSNYCTVLEICGFAISQKRRSKLPMDFVGYNDRLLFPFHFIIVPGYRCFSPFFHKAH